MTRGRTPCSVEDTMGQGAATAEATRQHGEDYLARGYAVGTYRQLGRTGLTVSSVGFGCRAVQISDVRHQAALREALYSGCNLIDTAAHYSGGESEQLVGHVLSEAEGLSRSALVVVTKLGAFTGDDLEWLRAQPAGDATYFAEDPRLSRSFHPTCLEQQLKRSLSRLSLNTVDIVLLESPEFLFDVSMNVRPQASDEEHARFVYDSLVEAFSSLEALVRQGLVSWYGVSSDGLSSGDSNQLTIDLERLMDCARKAGGQEHHFGVIQLPLSVLDFHSKGGPASEAVPLAASHQDLGLIAGRPLQAVVEGRLVRLTDFITTGSARVGRLMQSVVALENEFAEGLGKAFEMEGMEGNTRLFDNAKRLVEVADALRDYVLWREFVEDVLEMELSGLIGHIDAGLTGPLKVAWTFWLERYIKAISLLVDGLTLRSARVSQRQSRRITKWLRPLVPGASNSAVLAQLSLVVVRDLPGVHSVLVGMRRIQYAIDAMETMNWPINLQSVERIRAISDRFAASGAS